MNNKNKYFNIIKNGSPSSKDILQLDRCKNRKFSIPMTSIDITERPDVKREKVIVVRYHRPMAINA